MKTELADIVPKDFEFGGALVTIHEVDLTPDLKQAHVYLGYHRHGKIPQRTPCTNRAATCRHHSKLNQAASSSRTTPHLHF